MDSKEMAKHEDSGDSLGDILAKAIADRKAAMNNMKLTFDQICQGVRDRKPMGEKVNTIKWVGTEVENTTGNYLGILTAKWYVDAIWNGEDTTTNPYDYTKPAWAKPVEPVVQYDNVYDNMDEMEKHAKEFGKSIVKGLAGKYSGYYHLADFREAVEKQISSLRSMLELLT